MATILVADDNSNIQKMVTLALKDQGINVVAVGNGEAAVRKLAEVQPDLVLADIFMPVRNGYEVCEFVKKSERFAHVPVVLLVGAFDPLDESEKARVGADGVLWKPKDLVPPDPLIALVKSMLARAAAAAAPAGAEGAVESTLRLTPQELAALTSQPTAAPPPPTPPEPEVEEYAVREERIEISEEQKPVAFEELLETGPAEAEPKQPPAEAFQASSFAGVEAEGAPAEEEAPPPEAEWGGIREELKQPAPEEPPIKVEFGPSEHFELVTEETSAQPTLEVGPSADLATSPSEWMEAGPAVPPVPPGAVVGEEWTAAPPVAAPLPEPVREIPHEAPPPVVGMPIEQPPLPVEEPGPPPAPPVEAPVMEEVAAPVVEAEVPAKAVPPVEEVVPPPVIEAPRVEAPPITEVPAKEVAPPPIAAPAPAVVESFPVSRALDPLVVEEVVDRVLERLQPHVVHKLMQEVLRPLVRQLAQAMLHAELEKKEKE